MRERVEVEIGDLVVARPGRGRRSRPACGRRRRTRRRPSGRCGCGRGGPRRRASSARRCRRRGSRSSARAWASSRCATRSCSSRRRRSCSEPAQKSAAAAAISTNATKAAIEPPTSAVTGPVRSRGGAADGVMLVAYEVMPPGCRRGRLRARALASVAGCGCLSADGASAGEVGGVDQVALERDGDALDPGAACGRRRAGAACGRSGRRGGRAPRRSASASALPTTTSRWCSHWAQRRRIHHEWSSTAVHSTGLT